MKINNCLLVLPFIVLISCQPTVKSNMSQIQKRIDTLVNANGIQLIAIFNDSVNYVLEYSNSHQKGSSPNLKMPPMGLPKVLWFDSSWIYLQGGCGSPCFYAYLIPLNGIDTLRTYMFPAYINQTKRILAYCNDNDVLTIENFQVGNSVTFSDENLVGPYCSRNIKGFHVEGSRMVLDIMDLNGKMVKRSIDISKLLAR